MKDININETDAESTGSSLAGVKILWVEDDELLCSLVQKKLSLEKAELTIFKEGERALEWLNENKPDIILLDILISGMDGYEILRRIRERPQFSAVPILLLSNLGQDSDKEKGTALGATKYLVKANYTLDEIVKEIKDILKK